MPLLFPPGTVRFYALRAESEKESAGKNLDQPFGLFRHGFSLANAAAALNIGRRQFEIRSKL
jgi:hypothetical protein